MLAWAMRKTLLSGLVPLVVYCLVTSCSAVVIDNDSPPEVQYADGERLLKRDRYIEAVERFRILKSRYPYSKYAALASLRIGDAHFQEETYLEAASAYKVFRELYPKHEQTAYALLRIGESYINLMPSSTDRDLDPATSAITAFQQLIREYPDSSHRAEAEKKIHDLRGNLAEKENYVGDFYFKRDLYESAASRYAFLLQNFPEYGYNEEALYRLAFAWERLGQFERANEALDRLERDFPDRDKGKREDLREAIEKGKAQSG